MMDGPMVRLFWQALDALDYQVMQARFWLSGVLCGSEARMMPDEWRKLD